MSGNVRWKIKKEQIDILAGGNSSVLGIDWYFVGINSKQLYVVINHHEFSKDDLNGWEIREYYPGRKIEELEHIKTNSKKKIIGMCINQKDLLNINLNDNNAIRNLYWDYKK